MNKILGIVIAAVVIIGGGYYLMNSPKSDTASTEQKDAQGRVVFSVTDAAADMGVISEINMKISKVEAHSAADGWVTVSTTPRAYRLLSLNARNDFELLADGNMKVGTYDQVRLFVDAVTIDTTAGVTKAAKLPSGVLKINTELIVKEGTTSSVSFDFVADKSVHTTGNGTYIFAPVVKTEAKSDATVSIATNGIVEIDGGKTNNVNTVGMDLDGSVKVDFRIKSDAKLEVGSDNVIKIKGLLE